MNQIKSFTAIIETERLVLRPYSLDDVDAYYQINLDPDVSKYTNDGGVKTKEEIYRTIKENVLGDYKKYGFGRYAVVSKKENELIGFSGMKFLPEHNGVDLGYRYKKAYWGKGIATEAGKASLYFAFHELKFKNILGFVLPDNKASIRVLEKLNFTFEKEFYEEDILIHQFNLELNEVYI